MYKVCWLSGGVSSFIAAYIMRNKLDAAIYIDIDDQHPDTLRFLQDCSDSLDMEIQVLRSTYGSVNDVIRQFRFINSAYGAKCTDILKKRVRKEWELEHKISGGGGGGNLCYVWGYDSNEKSRAERLEESMPLPKFSHRFPLIERNLSKQDAHGMLAELGIKRPAMYDMGYSNNNCIGCVKGGMGYWNKIRIDFPEVFASRAAIEREIGFSCLRDCYLDELEPNRGNFGSEILEECSIICQLELENL